MATTKATTVTSSYYQPSSIMNVHNMPSSYMSASQNQPAVPPPVVESRFDRAYLSSIRAMLKFAGLLFCFIAFVCVVSTAQCGGNHAFLASVAWLVILMQLFIIICFVLRLKTRFPAIDFEFLDFFATAHDALYLLIASSVTIHYCRNPGQVAGGVMGIFAFLFIAGDALVIFMARRDETNNANSPR